MEKVKKLPKPRKRDERCHRALAAAFAISPRRLALALGSGLATLEPASAPKAYGSGVLALFLWA
jgi:hypothetical protein